MGKCHWDTTGIWQRGYQEWMGDIYSVTLSDNWGVGVMMEIILGMMMGNLIGSILGITLGL